ncbi:type IX secretion system membrane protein PorP/SprF [Chryseolinea soli]|uniref:Type IX secretion system membrane protein PorP/SprF n=1 Tax=Chryseolinea soli TaxID=2321403 RepID=A0A385SRQ9_9BACT|nr:type IX secretion system membrane protein PorP/SprF [Chryseolinea soli]AYB33859.1 type IX secretion system membrane protein PorP/SprF [Chryseolinea soli]
MKRFLLIAFVFAGLTAAAQDPQFSQYYQAPLYLNPGFTGITPQQRIVLNHRIQWPSLPQAFQTSAFSYDIFVNELRSGFGLLVTTDKMGSAGWRTTTASLLYSYKIKLTEKIVFSPGLSFGYGTNGLDRSKLRLGDGLEYDGISLDPDVNKLGRQSYFDFGSGFLLYSKSLWIGASFAHMNRPNLSVLNDVSRLGMKTAIHGGIRLDLSNGLSNRGRASYLTPSFIYRMQGNTFTQLDLGLNYHVDPISVGVWYRGKPFQKTVINSITQDALILYLGLYFKNLTIGYSYDFTISEMQTASGGAHEISIVYEFNSKPSNKSVKKKYKLIPCPTFNSKEGFWN